MLNAAFVMPSGNDAPESRSFAVSVYSPTTCTDSRTPITWEEQIRSKSENALSLRFNSSTASIICRLPSMAAAVKSSAEKGSSPYMWVY